MVMAVVLAPPLETQLLDRFLVNLGLDSVNNGVSLVQLGPTLHRLVHVGWRVVDLRLWPLHWLLLFLRILTQLGIRAQFYKV